MMMTPAGPPPEEPPLTEPKLMPSLFVNGFSLEVTSGVVHLVAWVKIPDLGGEEEERRIVARLDMPTATARLLAADLRKATARTTH